MQIRPDAGSQGAERVRKAELQTMLFYCQEVVLPFREGGKERQCLQSTGGGRGRGITKVFHGLK